MAVRVQGSTWTDHEHSQRLTTSFGSFQVTASQDMLLPDVSVLIYAHRNDSTPDHSRYAQWLVRLATGPEPFAISLLALSVLVRIVTNGRVFGRPSSVDEVLAFIRELTDRPNARIVGPGPDHLAIFERLCRDAGAAGKLVADAQHAAVAIEHGCTMVSTDSDFARFPGLRWQHPLAPRRSR